MVSLRFFVAQHLIFLFLPHKQFQTIFLLLVDNRPQRGVRGDLGKRRECMLGDFSAAYIAKYKVAGFDDPEAKIVLQQVAQSMKMDTADIESQHASSRQMLKSVVHSHNKANISARVVGRSLAERQQRAAGRGVVSVVAARNWSSEGSIIKTQRAVRSARATFISEHSAGERADFRKLSDEY